ncbi:hypothetical protein A0H81_06560 [Grifola frondosa]|uniref:Secreted protein n=1 Tax=Grifola frondosa TaxID=5627 RepID=A0A1C7MF39_GRIFR|nr:hypothetical protein A0H81_06560 [Grifola frondosa]
MPALMPGTFFWWALLHSCVDHACAGSIHPFATHSPDHDEPCAIDALIVALPGEKSAFLVPFKMFYDRSPAA